MKNYYVKISSLILLFSLAGCGSGSSAFLPPAYTIGPQTSENTAGLQVYVVGQAQPLSILAGVSPGQVIQMEARGAAPGVTVAWFSSNVGQGIFLDAGRLQIRGNQDFEIRVQAGPERKIIPVRVGDIDPDIHTNLPPPSGNSDPFMDKVVRFDPGPFSGFGSGALPNIVLGPPQGRGALQGGIHVLSLGVGGQIILRSEVPILDGPGEDFIVFENPFYANGNSNAPFAEPGEVSVSQNGIDFFTFVCEEENFLELYPGCAGVHPVYANSETNNLDPTDPEVAGGDAFDLDDLGLSWVQYIRIEDLSDSGSGTSAGFDLDAIAIIHQ